MNAWSKDQGVKDESLLTLFGDPHAELTRALDMELTHPGPVHEKGLVRRCKRCAYVVENGVIKAFAVAEKKDDPAGDDFPELTMVDNMLKLL